MPVRRIGKLSGAVLDIHPSTKPESFYIQSSRESVLNLLEEINKI